MEKEIEKLKKITMVCGDTYVYKGHGIYLNRYGEYNVLNKDGNEMETFNSSFNSLGGAKKYIDKLYEKGKSE